MGFRRSLVRIQSPRPRPGRTRPRTPGFRASWRVADGYPTPKRMATQDPPGRLRHRADEAVAAVALEAVLGARRHEATAGREPGRHPRPVGLDIPERQARRCCRPPFRHLPEI